MSDNLFDRFVRAFPPDRGRAFIETDAGRTYSFRDLDEISGRMARLLQSLGVHKGERVAVQVEKSPEAIFLYIACLRAGAVYLPLNTAYQKAEIAYFVGDAKPQVVVCRPENEAAISEIAKAAGTPHVLTLDQAGGGTLMTRSHPLQPSFPTVPVAGDDLAAILYTS